MKPTKLLLSLFFLFTACGAPAKPQADPISVPTILTFTPDASATSVPTVTITHTAEVMTIERLSAMSGEERLKYVPSEVSDGKVLVASEISPQIVIIQDENGDIVGGWDIIDKEHIELEEFNIQAYTLLDGTVWEAPYVDSITIPFKDGHTLSPVAFKDLQDALIYAVNVKGATMTFEEKIRIAQNDPQRYADMRTDIAGIAFTEVQMANLVPTFSGNFASNENQSGISFEVLPWDTNTSVIAFVNGDGKFEIIVIHTAASLLAVDLEQGFVTLPDRVDQK